MEGSGCVLILGTILAFHCRTRGIQRKSSVRIVDVLRETRRRRLHVTEKRHYLLSQRGRCVTRNSLITTAFD
jgi:hypothetical protein